MISSSFSPSAVSAFLRFAQIGAGHISCPCGLRSAPHSLCSTGTHACHFPITLAMALPPASCLPAMPMLSLRGFAPGSAVSSTSLPSALFSTCRTSTGPALIPSIVNTAASAVPAGRASGISISLGACAPSVHSTGAPATIAHFTPWSGRRIRSPAITANCISRSIVIRAPS